MLTAAHPSAHGVPAGPPVTGGRSRLVLALDIAAKVALAACLVHSLVRPDLPQYQDKAMGYRLVLYPAIAVAAPLWWWARGRRRRSGAAFPWLIDLCATAPFLFDSAGNAWNLYDSIEAWDDVMHVATWIPWVAAFALLVAPRVPDRPVLAGLAVAFGSVTHVLWEIAEYLSFVQQHRSESLSAYRDTVGDLALSLVGTVVAAALVARTRPVRAVGA